MKRGGEPAKRRDMADTRILPLEGIHNFRDYGGYRGLAGARVRSGVLWRSAQHGDASEADLAVVARLGLETVIDLRGPSERQAKPCRRPVGFAATVLFHDDETAGLALHVDAAGDAMSAEQARAAMIALYEGIAWRANLLPMLRRYFAALETCEGASLVHCVAGKDRTGFAVALLHHVLGVHRDDSVADYVLTNVAGNIERRIAAGAEQIRAKYPAIDDATVRTLMGVDEAYIVRALEGIEARHGSLDAYLDDVIGLDGAAREALRARYLD